MIPENILLRLSISVLGILGFWVAKHIYKKKRSKNPFICPIKFDCDSVVNSDRSRLFGIPLEILGMAYYGFICISYILSSSYIYFMQGTPSNAIVSLMILLSCFAFLFSLYLIYVQVFILKKLCSWCFVSAFISISIFVLTYLTYDFGTVAETIIK